MFAVNMVRFVVVHEREAISIKISPNDAITDTR